MSKSPLLGSCLFYSRERVLQSNIGSYFCEVRTHEGLARSITSTARIEQAPPPCEKNHQEMSGEQMNQEEGTLLCACRSTEFCVRALQDPISYSVFLLIMKFSPSSREIPDNCQGGALR